MYDCTWISITSTKPCMFGSHVNNTKTFIIGPVSRRGPTLSRIARTNEQSLTHRGPVTHICVRKLTIIGSDNGLSPDRRQAVILTNSGIWLIGPLETNCSKILIEIHKFSSKKIHFKIWKMAAIWSRPQCNKAHLCALAQFQNVHLLIYYLHDFQLIVTIT